MAHVNEGGFNKKFLAEHNLNKFESHMSQSQSTCTQHKCFGGTATQHHHGWLGHVIYVFDFEFIFIIYLVVPGLICATWDLVPWPGFELRPCTLLAQTLSHWIPMEVVSCYYFFLKTGIWFWHVTLNFPWWYGISNDDLLHTRILFLNTNMVRSRDSKPLCVD